MPSSVKDYVRANLARYKVPRDVVFLHRTATQLVGKVLKRNFPYRKQPHESHRAPRLGFGFAASAAASKDAADLSR